MTRTESMAQIWSDEILKGKVGQLLEEFVFDDCQLGQHPKIRTTLMVKKSEQLVTVVRIGRSREPWTSSPLSVAAMTSGSMLKQGGNSLRAHLKVSNADDPSKAIFRSVLAVPVGAKGEILGVLNFDCTEKGYFNEHHIAASRLLSTIVLYSIEHAKTKRALTTEESVRLGKALQDVRRDLCMTQAEVAADVGTSRICVSRWERGGQPASHGQLLRWCCALGLIAPKNHAVVRAVDFPEEFLQGLQRDPGLLREIGPEQFERLIAERLERMGFDVCLTGSAALRDGGIDLIAVPKMRTVGTFLLAGQVKHHRGNRKTGRVAVDRLLSWKDSDFRLALLVTNTTFTKDARWVAQQASNRAFLRLRDLADVKRWIAGSLCEEEEWRELPGSIILAPGVSVVVPKPAFHTAAQQWPIKTIDEYDY